ncbi:hypothetical protein MBLNU230_g4189t1 [Neophaeotheca triangularis]
MNGYDAQAERLEDQLRRMMLNSSPASPKPNDVLAPHTAPNVPLQHPGPTGYSSYPGVPAQQQPQSQRPLNAYPGFEYSQAPQQPQPASAHPRASFGPAPYSQPYVGNDTLNSSNPLDPSQVPYRPNDYVPPHLRETGHRTNHHAPPQFRGPPARPFNQQRVQNTSFDPNAFSRPSLPRGGHMQNQLPRQLFSPNAYGNRTHSSAPMPFSVQYLQDAADREVPNVEMSHEERAEKDVFRANLESICHDVCAANPQRLPKVSLHCFGSLMSGFASQGSDMDLVIVVDGVDATSAQFSLLEDDLPRALEKHLLHLGYGARLLTRTRVPIIKICEKPGGSFLDKLRGERERWDFLPNELKYPHLHQDEGGLGDGEEGDHSQGASVGPTPQDTPAEAGAQEEGKTVIPPTAQTEAAPPSPKHQTKSHVPAVPKTRERKAGPLDFPKGDVGILCDIIFFNPLGIHNSHLLRCYSLCDNRVRPMVLFVKAWAKRRKINSSYSGTLPSYGYVLMVLHYLTNVARPPVVPNLQGPWRPSFSSTLPGANATKVEDWEVDFWRNEEEIVAAAKQGLLTTNQESLGSLLAGFFRYFASQNGYPSFNWMREVIALKKPGGIWTKQEKGWTGARTEQTGGKEVRHRYLFCIEDPFELSHNVARTVTHHGIVAIRDEFRRANRVLLDVGYDRPPQDGHLLEPLIEPTEEETQSGFANIPKIWSGKPAEATATRQQQPQPLHQYPLPTTAPVGAPRGPAQALQAPLGGPQVQLEPQPIHQGHPHPAHFGTPRGQTYGRPAPRGRGYQPNGFRGQRGAMHQQPRPQQRNFDSSDETAFPALGAPKPGK